MVRLSPTELRSRFSELREHLNQWDPVGVLDDPEWPRDEYDCLVGPVLRLLEAGASAAEIATFLRGELRDHFGVDPGWRPPEPLAERIVTWYHERWPGSESVPRGD